CGSTAAGHKYVLGRKFIERPQHRRAAERIGAPGIGTFAVIETAQDVGPANRCRYGHAVPQPLAKDNDIGLQAIGFKGKEVACAPEVGLHLIENEYDVVLAAECLEQLQVLLGRMVRAAAAQVWFRDQHAEPPAEF